MYIKYGYLSLMITFSTVTARTPISRRQGSRPVLATTGCFAANETGQPDPELPCNAVAAIEGQCLYGPIIGLALFSDYNGVPSDWARSILNITSSGGHADTSDYLQQDNDTQRTCICESQFFDQANGCLACAQAFSGYTPEVAVLTSLGAFATQYCAVDSTPTLGFSDAVVSFHGAQTTVPNPWGVLTPPTTSTESSPHAATRSTQSGTETLTAVSDYYTLSVTGSPAYVVAEETGAAGLLGPGTFTSTHVVGGQILPTASPVTTVTHSSESVFSQQAPTITRPTTSSFSNAAEQSQQASRAFWLLFVLVSIALTV